MGCAKTILKRNFIAINAYIGKEERFQINDLSFYLKKYNKRKLHVK